MNNREAQALFDAMLRAMRGRGVTPAQERALADLERRGHAPVIFDTVPPHVRNRVSPLKRIAIAFTVREISQS